MSLVHSTRYPANTVPPDASYPFGSALNSTAPGAKNGYPYEKDNINDILGFLQGMLTKASVTPSGNPDTVLVSDYLDSLQIIIEDTGEFILSKAATFVSTTTYTIPTDVTAEYPVGRRLRLNDGGFVFGEVVSSSFGAGNTTVTVSMDGAVALTVSLTTSEVNIIENIRGIQPIGLTIPRNNNDSFNRPIFNFGMGASPDINFWANSFAQNFVFSTGGSSLNNAASGTKDGNNNLFIGFGVGDAATTAFACAGGGFNSLNSLTTGDSLTAWGYQSGIRATTAKNGVYVGTDAGFNVTTADNVVAIGRHIFFEGSGSTDMTVGNIVAIGTDIGLNATTMQDMCIMGTFAQQEGTVSARSVVMGQLAAQLANQVDDSIIVGRNTVSKVTSIISATIEIGDRVNENALTVSGNVIVGSKGFFTLATAASATTGNTASGADVGSRVYGINNTLFGNRSGAQPADSLRTGMVCLGYRSGDGFAGDNDLIISNSQVVANSLINGNFASRILKLEALLLSFRNLPNSAPAGGNEQVWYDPGDSNRLKFVP